MTRIVQPPGGAVQPERGHKPAPRANNRLYTTGKDAMRTHSRRVWPLLAADAVPAILAVFVLDGAIAGVLAFVALLGLIGCAIYGLAGEKVQDGAGGIAGGTGY